MNKILNRQDARNARDSNFQDLLFLATLASWRFKIIFIRDS